MAGFMKKMRDEAGRATFEAGRLVRVQREQAKLAQLQKERDDQLRALGEAAFAMVQAGQISDPRLTGLCAQVAALNKQIAAQEAAVEAIRQEQPPEPPKCPKCGREVSASDAFCPGCGAAIPAGAPVAPAAAPAAGAPAPAPAAPAAPAAQYCPQCGSQMRPGAAFCGKCGYRMPA